MEDEFELFKSEFKRWQEKFGLNGWATYFLHDKLEPTCHGKVYSNMDNMTAIVHLNNKLDKDSAQFKDIKKTAKHEAIHLLLSDLAILGRYRYVSEDELREAEEELVHKLEGLIN